MSRTAKSLLHLRAQINKLAPNRNKASDGTIGDESHQKSGDKSDHNPHVLDGGVGVVTAMDITHDPTNGCDCNKLVDLLARSRDPRIKYIIWNRRIISSTVSPWTWRSYSGRNPHSAHFHISVNASKHHYDSTLDWAIGNSVSPSVPSSPPASSRLLKLTQPFMRGEDVRQVQQHLRLLNYLNSDADVDGIFGPMTQSAVKKFQSDWGLAVDGIVGPITYDKLRSQQPKPTASRQTLRLTEPFMRGSDVQAVQQKLRALNYLTSDSDVDGIFGPMTDAAVKSFQSTRGLIVDGIVGPQTYGALGIG